MRHTGAFVTALLSLIWVATGCRSSDEEQAATLCDEARALEQQDLRRSLELRRKVWEEMPTAGTPSAKECGREVRVRMGTVRVLVATDETGSPEAIEGCAWTAVVMEVFDRALIPPYRANWARRLAERCVNVVGRAWTRKPDDQQLADLSARLEKLSTEPE
ncbi:MAG: hypothetical protein JRF63_01460 [Deltaproteobacteria bacterium]|nr:hypothetical protein [Deltaproteobacteria bacterium]